MAVIEATESNFDELVQGAEYVMVDFYGDSCGACVATAPYYREVAEDVYKRQTVQTETTAEPEQPKPMGMWILAAHR